MARQGAERAWHFAHQFDGEIGAVCSYSACESIRDTVIWLLPSVKQMRVPGVGGRGDKSVPVNLVDTTKADAEILVDGFSLLISLEYPTNHRVVDPVDMEDQSGLLLLDVGALAASGQDAPLDVASLEHWLTDSVSHKRWGAHPLLRSYPAVGQATVLRKRRQEARKTDIVDRLIQESVRPKTVPIEVSYECLNCSERWSGNPSLASHTCKNCLTHLYVRVRGSNS